MSDDIRIAPVQTSDPIVRALIQRNVNFATSSTTPDNVFALGIDDLSAPGILLYGLSAGGALAAIAALRPLGNGDCEIKSMHVAREFRGRGLGRGLLVHMLAEARSRLFSRVLLETGSGEAYEPARRLYVSSGFAPCKAFAEYPDAEESAFFRLDLLEQG